MKVTLLNYTQDAMELMIFTKNTRLTMSPAGLEEIKKWPEDQKLTELNYMANTIPSSWEFCDYTFMIEGITRACSHQIVRTRMASIAQQSMRVQNMSEGPGWDYLTGPTIEGNKEAEAVYHSTMRIIANAYKFLISAGVAIEDARGILPTNILTSLVEKFNMRTFVEMVHKRSSPRVQGEYRDVLLAMQEEVRKVHPWIDIFIDRTFDRAAKELDKEITEFDPSDYADGDEMTSWAKEPETKEWKTKILKLTDQLRSKQ